MTSTITRSCTQFVETTTVKLKIASQKSSDPVEDDLGGWAFLQALPNVTSKKTEQENVFVPISTKKYYNYSSSSTILSEKSLELCTENLGCETGSSDTMDDSDILSLSSPSPQSKHEKSPPQKTEYSSSSSSSSPYSSYSKNIINPPTRNFPPPLTTMSNGKGSLQIRPHREDGRLVMTAVAAPVKQPCFKAERSQGRLMLTFVEEDGCTEFDSEVLVNDDEEVEEEEEYEESGEVDNDFLSDDYYYHRIDEDDDEESGAFMSENIIVNIEIEGVELGMEKFQRLINSSSSRCNEGLVCNWEPLWVQATS